MLVRRSALREVGGLDEDFFLYCEDTDLCARAARRGPLDALRARSDVARHEGGASAPREQLLALHAHNRVLYARKHTPRPSVVGLEAFGVALGHGTHALDGAVQPSAAAATCTPCRPRLARPRAEGGLAMCGIAGAFRTDGGRRRRCPSTCCAG